MHYYKIIKDNEFIGVVNSNNFIHFNSVISAYLRSNEREGEFISYNGLLYRDAWMAPIINRSKNYISADILTITEEQYNDLYSAIENNETIALEEEVEQTPEPVVVTPDITIEFARESKLKEMSYQCRHAIENGFNLELRNEIQHFSLDTQDQLNLMSLNTLADTMNQIPYHADGQECVFYTAEEIHQIVAAANQHKIYHTTYYNALKIYINALQTVEEIAEIYYGIEIPEEYQTEVLKNL